MEEAQGLEGVIPNFGGAPTLQGFDTNNVADGQRIRGNKRQFVQFYWKEGYEVVTTKVRINEKTGSATILERETRPFKREYVKIITPGDKNSVDDRAEDFHKREHWAAYKGFRDGNAAPIGKPVDECEYISPSIATELRYLGCHTQEQLADASDLLCGRIPNGYELRHTARAICTTEASNQPNRKVELLRAELEEERKAKAAILERLAALEAAASGSESKEVKPKRAKKNEIVEA